METREKIIQVGIRLLAQDGAEGISMRKLASLVGIQAASIYEHFPNKSALLSEVRIWAWNELTIYIEQKQKSKTAANRLVNAGMAYYFFAEERSEIFSLLFHATESTRTQLSQPVDSRSPYTLLMAAATEIAPSNGEKAEQIAFGIWSLAHGTAVLRQTHLRGFNADSVERLLRKNLTALVGSFKGEA